MIRDDPAPEDPKPRAKTRCWPRGAPPTPAERIESVCPECGLVWWIHRDLGGSRMRCDCAHWLEVPHPEASERLVATASAPSAPECRTELTTSPTDTTVTVPKTLLDGIAPGALATASHDLRRRWTDRTLLELMAMMAAFWVPALVIQSTVVGRDQALLLPFAGLASGLMVLVIGLTAGALTFGAVRPAAARHFGEAVAVAGGTFALAVVWAELLGTDAGDWLHGLRDELGLGLSLFVVALCPAVFEELAFRGLLLTRATVLFGARLGILVTGTAFALAHGVTTGFPFHVLLGMHLGWLRWRSGSVIPGMVEHFLYNSAVLLAL